MVFGRAAPLAAVAKQSTLTAGAIYALSCFLLTGPVALLGAVAAWRELGGYVRWVLAAVVLHFVAVAVAGGDWMPLSRLVTPVLPASALVVAAIGAAADQGSALRRWAPRVLVFLAVGLELFVWAGPGLRSRRVLADRMQTIESARPGLEGARVIGTLDVGWVGVAAPDAAIFDFAGVTDPMIAVLPGGHTSKPIPDEVLAQRSPDALVLLLDDGAPLEVDWTRSRFARGVERWIALSPGIGEAMAPERVTEGRLRYVILRKR